MFLFGNEGGLIDKMIDEKSCENCRYYSQHYSKQGTMYRAVSCGHCLHRDNQKMKSYDLCDFWENISIKKEERKNLIKDVLENMSERLTEIALILKDDKE